MRRILILTALFLISLGGPASAQLDKAYFFWMGRGFIINDQYQDAIETLNILLKVDEKSYEAYFLRGIAKYNLDDLLGAEGDFTLAIQTNPVFTRAYQYRAITRSRLGNYDDALRDFQEAIALRPDLPGPYFSRGVTYLLSQQPEKAVSDFTNFIHYESKVPDAYLNRGTAYLMLKDTVRGMEDFELAIRTNRERPDSYARRGTVYLQQKKYDLALADFDKSLSCDSAYVLSYFNRAMVYASTDRPVQAIEDFSNVVRLDSTNSQTYFNRAILRTQIGDYNRALEDYDQVERYSPGNVLLYYNRAMLRSYLGDYPAAIGDYTRAIELYPDFANAYLGRSTLRYMTRDTEGSQADKRTAELKIAEYRAKLNDSTFSVYADTSKRFNQLLSFEPVSRTPESDRLSLASGDGITLLPMFKFSLVRSGAQEAAVKSPYRYYVPRQEQFLRDVRQPMLRLVNRDTDLTPEELFALDNRLEDSLRQGISSWQLLFKRAVTQSLIKQYTSSIACYTAAIDRDPSNPFLYLNRSTTQSEMIDFISSIDNDFQRISIDTDPASRLKSSTTRRYDYDEAIGDLNKAAKLLPEYAYIYYNRANLYCRSGMMSEALEDYTRAIELNPSLGEAYFNRGLLQIFLKDTRKGYLDISKAGELGIREAYEVLKRYTNGGE